MSDSNIFLYISFLLYKRKQLSLEEIQENYFYLIKIVFYPLLSNFFFSNFKFTILKNVFIKYTSLSPETNNPYL